jgi:hypothetical protein
MLKTAAQSYFAPTAVVRAGLGINDLKGWWNLPPWREPSPWAHVFQVEIAQGQSSKLSGCILLIRNFLWKTWKSCGQRAVAHFVARYLRKLRLMRNHPKQNRTSVFSLRLKAQDSSLFLGTNYDVQLSQIDRMFLDFKKLRL